MELTDLILWAIGILISVLLAFLAVKKVVSNRRQTVKADRNATVIQSGRDTKIK